MDHLNFFSDLPLQPGLKWHMTNVTGLKVSTKLTNDFGSMPLHPLKNTGEEEE